MRTKPRNGAILDSAPTSAADERDDVLRMEPIGLRPAQACLALGVSRRVLSQWTADRTLALPHTKIGGCIVYPTRELRNWLAARIERPR